MKAAAWFLVGLAVGWATWDSVHDALLELEVLNG